MYGQYYDHIPGNITNKAIDAALKSLSHQFDQEPPGVPSKKIVDSPQIFWPHFFFKDKSRILFKFVSVLLSAAVERVGVSRMRDFYIRVWYN